MTSSTSSQSCLLTPTSPQTLYVTMGVALFVFGGGGGGGGGGGRGLDCE